jgi:hypothetical protein
MNIDAECLSSICDQLQFNGLSPRAIFRPNYIARKLDLSFPSTLFTSLPLFCENEKRKKLEMPKWRIRGARKTWYTFSIEDDLNIIILIPHFHIKPTGCPLHTPFTHHHHHQKGRNPSTFALITFGRSSEWVSERVKCLLFQRLFFFRGGGGGSKWHQKQTKEE